MVSRRSGWSIIGGSSGAGAVLVRIGRPRQGARPPQPNARTATILGDKFNAGGLQGGANGSKRRRPGARFAGFEPSKSPHGCARSG
jgi:hypothetical protein